MSAGVLFGLSAANAALNTGTGLLSQGLSYYLNEKAAQNADQRTRQLFHDLYSPQAQVEQLQDAGLSTGLMYAKGGVGGSGAGGAQAAPATNQIGNVFDLMQTKLMDAQIKNIEADTNKKLGESKQIDQTIINMLTDNKLTESKIAYQNLVNILTNYEIKYKDATLETDIEQRKTELAKMVEEYRTAIANAGSAEIRLQIEDATANAKIKQELQKVLMNDLQMQAQKMNLKLTEKQIEMLQQNIIEKHLTNAWIDIKNETDISKIKNDIQMEIKRMGLAEDQQTYDMCMGVFDSFLKVIKPFGKK